LTDGTIYELVVTQDPATETNMKNLVARASGGLRVGNEVPVPVMGADGATHLAPPTTVRLNLDGSIDADQEVLLGAVLPASPDPTTSGQCWGIDAAAADWLAIDADSFALKWISQDGNHDYRVNWRPGGTMCLAAVQSDPWVDYFKCWNVGPTPGRHRFQYCITPGRARRIYVDGLQVEGESDPIPASFLPHLEDASTSLLLGSVSSQVKLWRVWACAGSDPAACP
jgi:hypothetical protein